MMSKGLARAGVCLLVVAALSACEGTVQEKLGLSRPVPDEFQVVRRAPLVLPPDFNLRPPKPGAKSARQDTSLAAREILTGRTSRRPAGVTPGERALLQAVKVKAEPDIRRKLLEEEGTLVDLDRSRFLFVLDFQKKQLEPKGHPIDPQKEAERLQKEGRAVRVITHRIGSAPVPSENPS